MSDEPQTVFITKYALTKGIEEREGVIDDGLGMVSIKGRYNWNYFHRQDWHRTREAALARAEQMRLAKIASYERSVAKLRKLSFS